MNDQNLVNKPVDMEQLIADLREYAEWADGNIYNVPLPMPGVLRDAADRLVNDQTHITALQKEIEGLQKRLELSNAERDANTKRMIELEQGKKWIPVTERLPVGDDQVLVVASGKPRENIELVHAVEIASLYSDGWCLETWPEWTGAAVTHWMPLPEAPEVE